ncbi:MAG: hypothetical protein M1814_001040 [Vezdaea aestivalis]|nr:MAG: hypothetical protein M1814_001040 [Vezdaea aestivalis]
MEESEYAGPAELDYPREHYHPRPFQKPLRHLVLDSTKTVDLNWYTLHLTAEQLLFVKTAFAKGADMHLIAAKCVQIFAGNFVGKSMGDIVKYLHVWIALEDGDYRMFPWAEKYLAEKNFGWAHPYTGPSSSKAIPIVAPRIHVGVQASMHGPSNGGTSMAPRASLSSAMMVDPKAIETLALVEAVKYGDTSAITTLENRGGFPLFPTRFTSKPAVDTSADEMEIDTNTGSGPSSKAPDFTTGLGFSFPPVEPIFWNGGPILDFSEHFARANAEAARLMGPFSKAPELASATNKLESTHLGGAKSGQENVSPIKKQENLPPTGVTSNEAVDKGKSKEVTPVQSRVKEILEPFEPRPPHEPHATSATRPGYSNYTPPHARHASASGSSSAVPKVPASGAETPIINSIHEDADVAAAKASPPSVQKAVPVVENTGTPTVAGPSEPAPAGRVNIRIARQSTVKVVQGPAITSAQPMRESSLALSTAVNPLTSHSTTPAIQVAAQSGKAPEVPAPKSEESATGPPTVKGFIWQQLLAGREQKDILNDLYRLYLDEVQHYNPTSIFGAMRVYQGEIDYQRAKAAEDEL